MTHDDLKKRLGGLTSIVLSTDTCSITLNMGRQSIVRITAKGDDAEDYEFYSASAGIIHALLKLNDVWVEDVKLKTKRNPTKEIVERFKIMDEFYELEQQPE